MFDEIHTNKTSPNGHQNFETAFGPTRRTFFVNTPPLAILMRACVVPLILRGVFCDWFRTRRPNKRQSSAGCHIQLRVSSATSCMVWGVRHIRRGANRKHIVGFRSFSIVAQCKHRANPLDWLFACECETNSIADRQGYEGSSPS